MRGIYFLCTGILRRFITRLSILRQTLNRKSLSESNSSKQAFWYLLLQRLTWFRHTICSIRQKVKCIISNFVLISNMKGNGDIYRPKRSFGQGNIFTPVCHSVHRGGFSLPDPPVAWRTPPGADPLDGEPPGWRTTPPDGEPPPRMESPPRMENHPLDGEPPPRMENPPGWRTPPDGGTPPGWRNPPRKQTPAYGLRSAGTHPTGMHSCNKSSFYCFTRQRVFEKLNLFICESASCPVQNLQKRENNCDERSPFSTPS